MLRVLRNFDGVISQNEVFTRNSAGMQNYFKLFVIFEINESQVLSEFKNVNLVVLLSVCKTY